MLKKKSLLGAVVSAALLFGMGACGNSSSGSSSSGELTMTIWDEAQKKGMEEMTQAFMKENPNVKVKVTVTPFDQYFTKLETQARGNNMSDVFWMPPEYLPKYVNGDKLLDMSEDIKKDSVDMGKYPKSVVEALSKNGKVWAMPKDYSTVGLWYNKTLFDKAGVSYPDDSWGWKDLASAAEKLTNKAAGQYGIVADNDSNFYSSLMYQNNVKVTDANGKSEIDTPAMHEALNFANSFLKKGYSPSISDQASTTPDQYFESGKAAMIYSGSWMPSEYTASGQKVDVAPLPKGKIRATPMAGLGYAIAKNTKNADAAWKYVKFMSGKTANEIQAKTKTAIPAYEGTQDAIIKAWPDINFKSFVDSSDYGTAPYYIDAWEKFKTVWGDGVGDILAGKTPVDTGLASLNKQVQSIIDEYQK
ncbi:MAG: sugar ABC transporter substrate-binding protein [Bifidobacteriaceae bacterium]|nr:sugar ABC transporter substrate-binding protein [Bifidobacteriaceae bacterium]MCI1914982.1 sugar ABC transporter substrate-binding protein [Bifidobacteriaceae bacterium]